MQRVVDVVELRPGGVWVERHRDDGACSRPAVASDDRSVRFLKLIAHAAEQLLAAQDPSLMMGDLFTLIQEELQLDVFCNYRFNAPDRLALEAHGGLTVAEADRMASLSLGEAVCGCVARDRKPVHAIRVHENQEPTTQFVRAIGLRSYACTPLLEGDTLIGTLSFGRRWSDRFEDDELQFLHTVCHYVALAKQRLRVQAHLKAALASQEALLAELNHRVRNALQLVVGMLGLEADAAASLETRRAIGLLRDRILVVATTHRHLYQDEHLHGISVGTLLEPLAAETARRHGGSTVVRVEDDVVLPVEKAVAVALAVDDLLRGQMLGTDDDAPSELVVSRMPGALRVRCVAPPLPRPVEDAAAAPLESRFRSALLRQLRATISESKDEAGRGFVLDIPLDMP